MHSHNDIRRHHDIIVSFLRQSHVLESLIDYLESDEEKEPRKLLLEVLDCQKDTLLKQKKLAERFYSTLEIASRAKRTRLSRLRTELNESLWDFSKLNNIVHAIQLFFQTKGHPVGGHFACALIKRTRYSEALIDLPPISVPT